MAIHVGIDGFGRIGRLVFRAPNDPASSGRPCRGVEDRGNDAGFGSAHKVMHLSPPTAMRTSRSPRRP